MSLHGHWDVPCGADGRGGKWHGGGKKPAAVNWTEGTARNDGKAGGLLRRWPCGVLCRGGLARAVPAARSADPHGGLPKALFSACVLDVGGACGAVSGNPAGPLFSTSQKRANGRYLRPFEKQRRQRAACLINIGALGHDREFQQGPHSPRAPSVFSQAARAHGIHQGR